jgi:small acid-soluble spore protein I
VINLEIDIKNYIINNFKNDNIEQIRKSIDSSIKDNDDETLLGLGVFMGLIWNESDDDLKITILNMIKNAINKKTKESNDKV